MRFPVMTSLMLVVTMLIALPFALWPGVALGVALGYLLSRSRYQDVMLWFAGVPGFYLLATSPPDRDARLEALGLWVVLSLSLLLLGFIASRLRHEGGYAPVWALLLLLANPHGAVLAGVVLAQAFWTFERRYTDDAERALPSRRFAVLALVVLAPLLLLLTALGPLLPPEGFMPPGTLQDSGTVQDSAAVQQSPSPDDGEPGPMVRYVEAEPSPWARFASRLFETVSILIYPLVFILVFLMVILLLAHRPAGVQLPKGRVLPLLVAIFALLVASVFFSLLLDTQDSISLITPEPAAPPSPMLEPPAGVTEEREVPRAVTDTVLTMGAFGVLMVFIVLLLLIGLLARGWLYGRERQQGQKETLHDTGPAAQPEHPDDRIRHAYWRFLHAMQECGFRRRYFETPRTYAKRLAQEDSTIEPDLLELTSLYEAVRYGEQSREAHAQRAETIARRIPEQFKGGQVPTEPYKEVSS